MRYGIPLRCCLLHDHQMLQLYLRRLLPPYPPPLHLHLHSHLYHFLMVHLLTLHLHAPFPLLILIRRLHFPLHLHALFPMLTCHLRLGFLQQFSLTYPTVVVTLNRKAEALPSVVFQQLIKKTNTAAAHAGRPSLRRRAVITAWRAMSATCA